MRTDEKMTKIYDSLKILGCGNASEKIQDAIANGLDDPLSVVCLALGTAAVNVKNVGGKLILPSLGKDFFTSVGRQFFT